jgi:hypothetical protein
MTCAALTNLPPQSLRCPLATAAPAISNRLNRALTREYRSAHGRDASTPLMRGENPCL